MFWQKEMLRDGVSMAFNQTYELELPSSGLLGGLVLYIRSFAESNAFLTVRKWRLIDYISKIEVIGDGSEVIKSFDGRQALTSAFYDDFREPSSMWRTYGETPQRQWIPIHFGRGFMDELYGLDLSRFKHVSLKITNDVTGTLFQTDITLSVMGLWLRDAATVFAGYFREEEWKTWAPVAAAWEYSELPALLPIRRVLLRARPGVDVDNAKCNASFHHLMDDIEFTFRSGQVRVYRGDLEMLGHISVMEMPALAETRGNVDRTAGYGFETHIGYVTQAMGYGAGDVDGITTALAYLRKDVQESAQESGYRPANGPLAWSARGHGYGHCVPIYYARKPGLEDLLMPADVGAIDLNIQPVSGVDVSGDSEAAQNGIVLSRLVR